MDIVLISIIILSAINNFEKPKLPPDIYINNETVITQINGIDISSEYQSYEIEYIIDRYEIGDSIEVEISSNGSKQIINTKLIPYYDFFFAVVFILTLLIFLFIGVFVIREQYNEHGSRVFHNVVFAAVFLIGLTWGRINLFGNFIDVLLRVLYDFSYLWLGANMLHFSAVFPREKMSYSKNLFYPLYGFIIVIGALIAYIHYPAIINNSMNDFRFYLSVEEKIVPIMFIILVTVSIILFLHSYKSYKTSYDRQKIRWVLVGVIVAPFSFILFWLLPKKILGFPLIPEWFMLLLTTLAPISFYISIFKYRFFNIDVILSRSTVYSAVVVVVISIYIVLQKFIEYLITLSVDLDFLIPPSLLGIIQSPNLPVLISFIIIFLFYGTLKQKFQNFVDKRLFSETYKRKEANEIFSGKLRTTVSTEGIGNLTFSSLDDTLIAEKLGIIIYDLDSNEILYSKFSTHLSIPLGFNSTMMAYMRTQILKVAAIEGAIEDGYQISSPEESIVKITGINVFLFSYSSDRSKVLLTAFGENKKRFKYSHEEIDAALFKTDRAINSINRLFIMSHLTIKEKENKRLEELNDMKSYFISSVTHELKTPLTSIKIFAELMQGSQDISDDLKYKYLEIIQNECNRLNNLINNVLDFSKIERGVKEYSFGKVDFVHLIDLVMVMMQFQFKKNGFTVETDIPSEKAMIKADKDSITEVIINLLSNSMKYSDNEKHIIVKLSSENGHYLFTVEDRGNGISKEDIEHIFEAFYRSETVKRGPSGGAGIGLSLVENIIDAHKGDIEVESELGKGTIVKIYIPKGE